LKAKMDLCRKKQSEKSTASAQSLYRCRHDGLNEASATQLRFKGIPLTLVSRQIIPIF
jgi:hypothetical protein